MNNPILNTERLSLLPLSPYDGKAIFNLRSNTEVNKYLERSPPTDISEVEAFIEKITTGFETSKWYYWSIFSNSELIGTICIWNFSNDKTIAELGYELHPKYQGNGFMSEALKTVVQFAFEKLHLKQLDAFTHKKNEVSTRLLLKHSFVQDFSRVDEENANHIIFKLENNIFIPTKDDLVKYLQEQIIGHRIEQVFYGEINNQDGKFYFNGFHTFDFGVNFKMSNGFWWYLGWSESDCFEIGKGEKLYPKGFDKNDVKVWEATAEWRRYLSLKIKNITIDYIEDTDYSLPSLIHLTFENNAKIKICVAEELNLDGSLPTPFKFSISGEVYVFFDINLYKSIT